MKLLIPLCLVLAACGTSMVVPDKGPVEFNRVDGKNTPLAPLVLQYKFNIATDEYDIYFVDENKKEYRMKMDGRMDTSKGILIYLPADRGYTLKKFTYVREVSPRHMNYEIGTDVNMFKLDQQMVTYIGYFEISEQPGQSTFRLHKANKQENASIIKEAMSNLGFSESIHRIENYTSY